MCSRALHTLALKSRLQMAILRRRNILICSIIRLLLPFHSLIRIIILIMPHKPTRKLRSSRHSMPPSSRRPTLHKYHILSPFLCLRRSKALLDRSSGKVANLSSIYTAVVLVAVVVVAPPPAVAATLLP